MALQSDPIITEKDILENVNQQKKLRCRRMHLPPTWVPLYESQWT